MPMSPAPHVLIVEDEPRLARLVADYLSAAGYGTQILSDGLAVLPALQERMPDLLVLDLMLPGRDGLSLCQEIRRFSQVPIVMLTARVEEVDRLLGLDAGADDYICKPFSPREVVARVRAILRRARGAEGAPAAGTGPDTGTDEPVLYMDSERYEASLAGQNLGLTALEFRLLKALSAVPGRVLSRARLIDQLHDDQRALSDRTVDSHIKNLRRKLEQASPQQELIVSIYGAGYKFEGRVAYPTSDGDGEISVNRP